MVSIMTRVSKLVLIVCGVLLANGAFGQEVGPQGKEEIFSFDVAVFTVDVKHYTGEIPFQQLVLMADPKNHDRKRHYYVIRGRPGGELPNPTCNNGDKNLGEMWVHHDQWPAMIEMLMHHPSAKITITCGRGEGQDSYTVGLAFSYGLGSRDD